MKVLVADKFEQSGLNGLKSLGCEVISNPELKDDALRDALAESGAEVLVVRSTKVTKDIIDSSQLALIVRAGAGYNTIDVEAASAKGIYVANCPGKNSIAVAELAFGLILALDRHIADNVAELRAGHWDKKTFSKSRGIYGTTLGLIGLGQIGQEMIPRARAFGMSVIVFSRWMTAETAAALGVGRAESLTDLARQADTISVHVALTKETQGMLNEEFFSAMKPGATLINTSRAEVVDQEALLAATGSGKIKAGLDVFADEPTVAEGSYSGPMCNAKNIYCTHHIGASTDQAQEAVAAETVRIVAEFKTSGIVPNVVNVSKKGEVATHLLVVRHQDRVGVLSHVLGALKDESVNVQEMENIVLGGAQAAIAQISLSSAPSPETMDVIRTHPFIFDASLFPIKK
ncbi:MAG: 3-phosphoglycerate dehydrogenase family protein [Fimbriimonadaceae bacterium]|jgi:D-3-phosphoglycerate dehydrogenase|nr:3-phosphoglycerate dehydrogenase family protein [Fimbriimonadaceae bacterium]